MGGCVESVNKVALGDESRFLSDAVLFAASLSNKVPWRLYCQPMNLHAAGSDIHSSPSQPRLAFPPIANVSEMRRTGEAAKHTSRPKRSSEHAHIRTDSYPPLFPLQPTVLIIHPFPGTACAIKRFLNEDEALRSKLFEWFLWMTQGLVASWEEDQTRRRRQLCWELSWVPCHLSLTFN